MYNPIEVSLAAAKAREELEKSGAVGRIDPAVFVATLPVANNTDGSLPYINLVAGERYNVHMRIDSLGEGEGTLTAKAIEMADETAVCIGDMTLFGADGESTGEEFLIMAVTGPAGSGTFVVLSDTLAAAGSGGGTFTIEKAETIHPIDPKFIPGAVLPVVELSHAESLTAEEQAQLTYHAERAEPIIVKVVVDGLTVASFVCEYLYYGEDEAACSYSNLNVAVFTRSADGTWTAEWK